MYRILLAAWITLWAIQGNAMAAIDLASVLGGIQKKYGNLPGLTLIYEREVITKSMTLLGDQVKGDLATGCMFFKPPYFLKLDQQTPTIETVISDEDTLWWHIPEQKRVYKYAAKEFGKELQLLSDIFRGLIKVQDRFKATLLELNNKEEYEIELRPVTPWQNMDRIILTTAKDYTIKKVSIHYQLGSVTLFTLKDIQSKGDFVENFFIFNVPDGCILIDETSSQVESEK